METPRNPVDTSLDLLMQAIKQSETPETRAILSKAVFYLREQQAKLWEVPLEHIDPRPFD